MGDMHPNGAVLRALNTQTMEPWPKRAQYLHCAVMMTRAFFSSPPFRWGDFCSRHRSDSMSKFVIVSVSVALVVFQIIGFR